MALIGGFTDPTEISFKIMLCLGIFVAHLSEVFVWMIDWWDYQMPLRLLMWYLHTLWWLVWMIPNAYQSILPKVIWIRIIFFPWHFWPLDCSRLSFWLTWIIPLWISFHEHCQIQSRQSIYWRAIFYEIFQFVIVSLWCSLFFLASSLLLSPLSFVAHAI